MPAVKLLETGSRQKLDRYELVAELASGGMATVYLGRIGGVGGFQRFVAIKRLHPHLANEQEFVEMFVDEARIAAGLHHPNVVPILDIGQSERGYYLVMEYIEGDTLARLLARSAANQERIPVPVAIRIILDTLAGLHAAHELKDEKDQLLDIVHRDVSPQNILVGIDGTSRITDFGVARATTRLSTTRAGQLKGKLAYMAPEQARGKDLDRRADVFAMGTVLWEVLAGRRLFKADGEAETLNRVLFEGIPKLRDADPMLPVALETVTMRALERDPDKRFDSCAEFADALERAAKNTRSIASVREVAAFVQKLLGQEIGQQRDAVRGWLAASEPSRTSLEGSLPALPPMSDLAAASASSVSSASISIPARTEATVPVSHGSGPTAVPEPRGHRGALVGALVGMGATVALALLWIFTRGAPPSPAPLANAASLPTAAVTLPPAATTAPVATTTAAPSAVPAPSATAEAAPSASAKPVSVPAGGGYRPRPVGGSAPAGGGDDISRNPYR